MIKPIYICISIVVLVFLHALVFSQITPGFNQEVGIEYSTSQKQIQLKFNEYVLQIDNEFYVYLKKNFKSYPINHHDFIAENPKAIGKRYDNKLEITDNIIDFEIGETYKAYQTPIYPLIKRAELNSFGTKHISFEYLGHEQFFDIDSAFFSIGLMELSSNGISTFWTEISKLNYNHFLSQLSEASNTLNLNQWGYYMLLKNCSEQVYPNNNNMQLLFQWAMLIRSQFKVKVGFDKDDKLSLLIPTVYIVYNMDYVNINGLKYYLMGGGTDSKKIRTYKHDFPKAEILMDLRIRNPINTIPDIKSKDFHFTFNDEEFTVSLEFDKQLLSFYQTIPLSDLAVYYNSVIGDITKRSIINSFTPILEGKTDKAAVNMLLSFVHQAFKDETNTILDINIKHMFPDDALAFSSSYGKELSVLFTYLVRTLLKTDCIALESSGYHLVAVNVGNEEKGTQIIYKNKTFVVADPNYPDAPTGVAMIDFSGKKTVVYPSYIEENSLATAKEVWIKIKEYGGFRANKMKQDIVIDEQGNIFVCGYIKGSLNFGNYQIDATGKGRDVFVAKFDAHLKPIWVRTAVGKGNDLAFNLALDENKALYVFGSFEKELSFSGELIKANGAADIFVAKYSQEGNLFWVKKAGLDTINHANDFIILTKYQSYDGKASTTLYSASEDFTEYGLKVDKDGNAIVIASFIATTGLSNDNYYISKSRGAPIDVPTALYEADSAYKSNEYEPTIAGIFAALNFLSGNTLVISSTSMKKTLETYSNKLKENSKEIYDNLLKMTFLKNESGIVTIKTFEGKPVVFDKIKIENNARIKIVKYKSGNILVQVFSSIYVGSQTNWLDLNSVKLFMKSGDLLFTYDTDDSKKRMNLKKEILKY